MKTSFIVAFICVLVVSLKADEFDDNVKEILKWIVENRKETATGTPDGLPDGIEWHGGKGKTTNLHTDYGFSLAGKNAQFYEFYVPFNPAHYNGKGGPVAGQKRIIVPVYGSGKLYTTDTVKKGKKKIVLHEVTWFLTETHYGDTGSPDYEKRTTLIKDV